MEFMKCISIFIYIYFSSVRSRSIGCSLPVSVLSSFVLCSVIYKRKKWLVKFNCTFPQQMVFMCSFILHIVHNFPLSRSPFIPFHLHYSIHHSPNNRRNHFIIIFFIYVFCSSTPTIFEKVILFSQSVAARYLSPMKTKWRKNENITTFAICIGNRFESINFDERFWVF